jgi:hypothetical protein
MTEHVLKAWHVDIDVRTKGISQHGSTGCGVNAHEIVPGVVHEDSNVKVTEGCVAGDCVCANASPVPIAKYWIVAVTKYLDINSPVNCVLDFNL